MALAKKCDRCGGLYEPKLIEIDKQRVNGIMLIERNSDNRDFERRGCRDFCPECLIDLIDFLKEPVTKRTLTSFQIVKEEGTNA